MKPAGQIFALIFLGVFLAVFVWFWDVRGVQVLMRQYQAQSFPKTEGQVLSVEIISQTGSKGRIYYHPAFLYTYEVNGLSYEGRRYRYDGSPSDYASVNQIVISHPAGSTIEVYYNPNNPADAVLSPLVVANDVSRLFLMSPVIFLFLFMFLKVGREIDWPGRAKPVAGGVKIVTEMLTTRARLPRYQPGWLGLITAGILSFIAGVAIEVAFASSPVPASLYALIIIIVAGALVYLWQYLKIASGIQDLVINEGARTIELPLTYKRRERRPLPFSEIKAVTLEMVAHQSRGGVSYNSLRRSHRYWCL